MANGFWGRMKFSIEYGGLPEPSSSEHRHKHLDYLQAVIARMANNSFLFKGWAITLASALVGLGAVESQRPLLVIALMATLLFWRLDGYHLWLEKGFIQLYQMVARKHNSEIDFNMTIDKNHGLARWLHTCCRWHLVLFYGTIILADLIGIVIIEEVSCGA